MESPLLIHTLHESQTIIEELQKILDDNWLLEIKGNETSLVPIDEISIEYYVKILSELKKKTIKSSPVVGKQRWTCGRSSFALKDSPLPTQVKTTELIIPKPIRPIYPINIEIMEWAASVRMYLINKRN